MPQMPLTPPAAPKKRRDKSDMTKIEQIRRRKHEKRLRTAAVLVLVLAAVLAYLGGFLSPSINFFSNVIDSVRIALLPGTGWPVDTKTNGLILASGLSSGAAVLDESDLVIYSPTAKELRRIPHGYADPAMSAAGARVVLYNRGSNEIRVESRTRTLMTKNTDFDIITAQLADNGSFAVATKAERYAAQITIYNASFEETYYCYLSQDIPMQMAFAPGGKRFAAACMRVENGAFGAVMHLYDTSSTEKLGEVSLPALPLEIYYLSQTQILAVCDSFAGVYDAATGEQLARYDYAGAQLLCADRYRKNIALCFGDSSRAATTRVVVLDNELQQLVSLSLGYAVRDVQLASDHLVVLSVDNAYAYDFTGQQTDSQTLETEGEFLLRATKPLVVTAKEILQLTY